MKFTKLAIVLLMWSSIVLSQTMTIEDFTACLKQNHPIFKKESLSKEIEINDQKSLLGDKDWQINSSVFVSRENPDMAISGPERTDALSISGGVEKLFWSTGSRLQVSATTSQIGIKLDPMISQMYDIPDNFSQNQLSVTYTHPLMKNRKGVLNQFSYKLKKYDIDFAEVESMENRETFLANSMIQYLNWTLLEEQVKITEHRLNFNKQELERTIQKRQENLVDEVDVFRAKDAVRIAEQNYILIKSNLDALKAELAVITQKNDLATMDPNYDLFTANELKSLDESIEILVKNSRILSSLRIRINQLVLVRKGYKEEQKPSLDLVSQLSTHKIGDKALESLKMDNYDMQVGLQLQVPLEKRRSKFNVEKTQLQIKQLEEQYEEVKLTLVSQLTNLYTQIIEMEKVLQLNREQIESSKAKTTEEQKLYNQGRSALTFVIQSRDSEEQAALLYSQNAATYQQLIIQYKSLMDEIYR